MLKTVTLDNPNLALFRDAARALSTRFSPKKPISTIAIFGAQYSESSGLSQRDNVWLAHTLSLLGALDLGVAPNLKIVPVNMVDGDDILDPKLRLKSDVVVSAFVINPDRAPPDYLRDHQRTYGSPYNVSPFHSKEAYPLAMKNLDARLAVTFSKTMEVNASDFVTRGYAVGSSYRIGLPSIKSTGPRIDYFAMETVLRHDLQKELRHHYRNQAKNAAP